MGSLLKYLSLYFEFGKRSIAQGIEFKTDFIIGTFVNIIYSFLWLLFQILLYQNSKGYPNWTFDKLLLFQSILLFWNGVVFTLFGSVQFKVCPKIIYGLFDVYFLRPYSPLLVIFAEGLNYYSIGNILAGIALFVYSAIKISLKFEITGVLLFLMFFAVGILFYLAILIFFLTIALKLVYVFKLFELKDRLVTQANIPADVFSGVFKIIFMSVFPFALWAYFPAQALMGRLNIFSLYACLIGIAFFLLAVQFWKQGLKKYSGAGG